MEASVKIFGVDFSGAAPDNNTWMAQGWLSGAVLELVDCLPLSREEVADKLDGSPSGSVASLDFPFSVPNEFATYWMPQARAMPQLWNAAAQMDYPAFLALRDSYVAEYGETKRRCDERFPECYSCLHKANPNMVPMTFRGMQMLDRLWNRGCDVPPLDPQGAGKPVLLEAMPGAALKALGLPYKGYKNGVRAPELREKILDGLAQRSGLAISNLGEFEERCRFSHDCLDAVVAAVIAALWARQPELFWRPEDSTPEDPSRNQGKGTLELASLEGWLYAPVNIHR